VLFFIFILFRTTLCMGYDFQKIGDCENVDSAKLILEKDAFFDYYQINNKKVSYRDIRNFFKTNGYMDLYRKNKMGQILYISCFSLYATSVSIYTLQKRNNRAVILIPVGLVIGVIGGRLQKQSIFEYNKSVCNEY